MQEFREKIARFSLKHHALALILYSAVFCGVFTFLLMMDDVKIGIIIAVDVFFILLSYMAVYGASAVLLQKPLQLLDDHCYPEALFEETEEQLKYIKKGYRYHGLIINRSAALICMGRLQEAKELLESFNVETIAVQTERSIYYSNLANILLALGDREKADIWAMKARQNFDAIPNEKSKIQYGNMIKFLNANFAFADGNYHEALNIAETLDCKRLRTRVGKAFLEAKIHAALGDNVKAKDKIDFVLENGGTLYQVKLAKDLIGKIQ